MTLRQVQAICLRSLFLLHAERLKPQKNSLR